MNDNVTLENPGGLTLPGAKGACGALKQSTKLAMSELNNC